MNVNIKDLKGLKLPYSVPPSAGETPVERGDRERLKDERIERMMKVVKDGILFQIQFKSNNKPHEMHGMKSGILKIEDFEGAGPVLERIKGYLKSDKIGEAIEEIESLQSALASEANIGGLFKRLGKLITPSISRPWSLPFVRQIPESTSIPLIGRYLPEWMGRRYSRTALVLDKPLDVIDTTKKRFWFFNNPGLVYAYPIKESTEAAINTLLEMAGANEFLNKKIIDKYKAPPPS